MVYNPHHNDSYGHKASLGYCAPRLATLEPPGSTLAACHNTRGDDARNKIYNNEEYRSSYKGCYRAQKST